MKEKLTTLPDAVRRIASGSRIALGGNIMRRQANATVREIIRQAIGDLTVYAFAMWGCSGMGLRQASAERWKPVGWKSAISLNRPWWRASKRRAAG